jgi:3-deoxy-D-manno-octulosonate 8-phosphate phosphatase KdsC-like HAD superfamily phosphatase
MFNLTGYSVAVDGTIAEVRDAADSVTQKKGPLGVIEMLELLLR